MKKVLFQFAVGLLMLFGGISIDKYWLIPAKLDCTLLAFIPVLISFGCAIPIAMGIINIIQKKPEDKSKEMK